MDSTAFRITQSRRSSDHANFHACVAHWWAAIRLSGWDRDPEQLDNLLLAGGYGVLSGAKSTHQVFRDAHLAPGATRPQTEALADDVNRRIRDAIEGRDRDRVGREFDAILGAPPAVTAAEQNAMRRTFEGVLAHGRQLVQEHGAEGGRRFVARLDSWCAAKRKKGNQGWLRHFLNYFAYECKVAFYACFANAWIDIIPVLRRDHGLDPVGERFMRVWHMQSMSNPSDLFRGQVLSLHPLSGYFMKDPALMAVAGRFYGTDAYARVFERGEENVSEYWELIGAILTAGHLYRQALDRQTARRGAGESAGKPCGRVTVDGDHTSLAGLLEDYATSRGVRCPACRGELRLGGVEPADPGSDARATFVCETCPRTVPVAVRHDDLVRWCRDRD